MEFKEPKVEVIQIKTNQVVYASPNGDIAGGVHSCSGSVPADGCNSAKMTELNTKG